MMWRLCNHAAEETFPAGGIKTSYQEDTGGITISNPQTVDKAALGFASQSHFSFINRIV